MKINKMVCIDEEVNKKLEGTNASLLINNLLIEHFRGNDIQNLTILKKKFDENRQNLKKFKRNEKELGALINKIEEKESKLLEITKKNNYDLDIWYKAKELSKSKMVGDIKKIYFNLMKGGLK